MTKKNFSGGLNSLLGNVPFEEVNKPQEDPGKSLVEEFEQHLKNTGESAPEPVKRKVGKPKTVTEPSTRTTFIINDVLLEKFRAIAYWNRTSLKDVMVEAMTDYISKFEKKNGEILPVPDNSKK